jgi:hypothetical protein
MFKIKNILISILFLFLLLVTPSYAAKIEVGDYTLDKQSIVEDDLYVSGDSIVINGVVDGDLIAFGKNIQVDGSITGDIYLFGTDVIVSGSIYGVSVIGASTVDMSGTLRENVYVGSMMTNLDGTFEQDVMALSGTFKIDGSVGDDVRVAAGQVLSSASVGGDFLVGSDTYTLEENSIYGQVVVGTNELFRREHFEFSEDDLLGFKIGLSIVNFVGMYIVGLILIFSAPVKTLEIEKRIISSKKELLKSYGIGFIILLGIPIPLLLLTVTGVGAPLALLIAAALIFLSTFGTLWAESAIGYKILKLTNQKDNGRIFSLLIGRGVSLIMKMIPGVGGIYSISLIFLTIGSIARMKYDAFNTSRRVSKEVKKKKTTKKK